MAAQYTFSRLEPEYARLWATMRVVKTREASDQARRIIAHKDRYKAVEATTTVPWFVIGCLHMRESGASFTTWLHNGDPMKDPAGRPIRTRQRPPNRPPNPNCTWEEGAYDALVTCQHLDEIPEWSPARVAYAAESYNGWGYRNPLRDIPSPYLWGGTSVQKRGKFVRDGEYDSTVMDPQIGAMAVLQMLLAMDPEAKFETLAPAAPEEAEAPAESFVGSPAAVDTESNVKPLTHSKTMWGGLLSVVTGAGSVFSAFIEKLDNPYTLAAFLGLLGVLGFAGYLIVKGRLDVNAIVKHLSADDSEEK